MTHRDTLVYQRSFRVLGQAHAQRLRAILGERQGRLRIDEVYDAYSDKYAGQPKRVTLSLPLPSAVHYGDESDACEAWLWKQTRSLHSGDLAEFDEPFDYPYRVLTEHEQPIGMLALSANLREERDRLDGREFHAGNGLDILQVARGRPPIRCHWLPARYELQHERDGLSSVVHIGTWGGDIVVPLDEHWVCRWPVR